MVNRRRRRVLGCAPIDRIAADTAAMLTLPPVPPAIGWRLSGRLPRDYYVRLDANDYSVHPSVIGRRIEVVADLDRVRVFCDGRVVADHDRVWARHQTLTLPEHAAGGRSGCAGTGSAWSAPPPRPTSRSAGSADYDTALGLADLDARRCHDVTVAGDVDGTVAMPAGTCRRDRLPHPGVEGPDPARCRRAAGRTGPDRGLDP